MIQELHSGVGSESGGNAAISDRKRGEHRAVAATERAAAAARSRRRLIWGLSANMLVAILEDLPMVVLNVLAIMQTKVAGDGQSDNFKVSEKNETDVISALKTLDAAIATINAPTAASCAGAAQAT